jgi:hypothetical protein
MTPDDISKLVSLIVGFDRRTSGQHDDIAWTLAAQAGNWTLPLASRAVVEHYTHSTEWLMPAHITNRIIEVRRRLHESFQIPRHSPELADDGSAFVAWARARKAEHMATGLTEWATTGRLPALLELEA